MISCPMPQDIFQYKAKFIGNFTIRQLIWGTAGVFTIIISYQYIFAGVESSLRLKLAAIMGLPLLAIGFIKIYDQPLEKILGPLLIDNFLTPAKRLNEIHFPDFEKEHRINKESQKKLKKSTKFKEIK